MSKTWGFFFLAQDMVLSHRAKFQLIINFFRASMYFVVRISTGLTVIFKPLLPPKIFLLDLCLNFASVIFFIACVRVRPPTCKTKLIKK